MLVSNRIKFVFVRYVSQYIAEFSQLDLGLEFMKGVVLCKFVKDWNAKCEYQCCAFNMHVHTIKCFVL